MFHTVLPKKTASAVIAAMHSSLSKAVADRRAMMKKRANDGASRAEGTYGVMLPKRTDPPPTLPMGVSAPPGKSWV